MLILIIKVLSTFSKNHPPSLSSACKPHASMHFLLLSSRVQQPLRQPWLCPPGSLRTRSSSPAKVSASPCAALSNAPKQAVTWPLCGVRPPRSDPAGGPRSQRDSVHYPAAPAADPSAAADAAWRRAGARHPAGKRRPVLDSWSLDGQKLFVLKPVFCGFPFNFLNFS